MRTPRLPRRLGTVMLALSALAIAVAAVPLLAGGSRPEKMQGNGRIKSETRAPGHFTGVALGLPGSVELRIGNAETVTIEADDNLLPLIETVIEHGTLQIRPARRNLDIDARRLTIVVQAKGIDHLALGGSGSIEGDVLRGGRVMIDLGGSGSIRLKGIDSDALTVAVSGSGNLHIGGGAVNRLLVSIAGSGDVDLARLDSVEATVNVAGSGGATIRARDALTATIAGSGDVNYYGDPKVSKTIIGSGRLRRLGGASDRAL